MPLLDVSALRTQLQAGKLGPLYLFVGEDAKLVDRMVDAMEATIDEADRPFAVERLYAGEEHAGPIDIAAAARAYPMLGDRRIVFVMRAERLLKPKRASKASEVEVEESEDAADQGAVDFTPLEEYVSAPSPTSTLVFVAADVDKVRRFTKKLFEKAQVVLFGGLPANAKEGDFRAQAADLIDKELAREGRKIEPAARALLAERSAADVAKLRNDLERLLIYVSGRSPISLADVEEIAQSETTVTDDWALVNAIADGNAGQALRAAGARFDRGDSPHAMVGQLRWWVSNSLAEGAPDRVAPALEALLRTDLALKSSGGDDRVLLERLIVELTGRPIARRGGWR